MSAKSLFKNKGFGFLFYASLFGVLGEGIFGLTLIVIVLNDTNSIFEIGKMLVLTLLPSAILAPFIGVLIDKYNKYRIAVVCNVFRFIIVSIIPISYFLNFFNIEILYLSILFSYIFWYILEPTKESILKEVLSEEQYRQGISLIQGAWQVGLLTSAVFAGIFIDLFGTHETILIVSVTYIVGAIMFMFLEKQITNITKVMEKVNPSKYFEDFKHGWKYILSNKAALCFVLITSMTLPFFYAINALIAPFNYQVLNGTGTTLGIIDSGAGIGSLLSAVFCTSFIKDKIISRYLVLSIICLALSTFCFSLTSNFLFSFLIYLVIGFFVGNLKVLSRIYVFDLIETDFIGRVMTTVSLLSLSLSIFFSLLVTLLAEISIFYSYLFVAISLIIPLFLAGIGIVTLNKKLEIKKLGSLHN